MPKWEIGKTYKTVDGLDAKLIYKLDDEQKRPLVFVITERKGNQFIAQRDELGRLLEDQTYCLNVVPPEPVKTSRFVTTYDVALNDLHLIEGTYFSLEQALRWAKSNLKAVLELQYEDDELVNVVIHPTEGEESK